MPEPLLEAIKKRVLLCDGAMGTQLQQAGLKPGACGEAWNLDAPERVLEIQGRYREAGSDLILTNTFGGCRIPLARHGEAPRTREINIAAVGIVRQLVGDDGWVVGDIGPYGGMIEPYGDDEPEEVESAFYEQAAALLEGGADALMIETQTALEELECGVRAAKRAIAEAGRSVPLIGSMAFDRTVSGPPKTMMGVDPKRAAERMLEWELDIIACNCGTNLGLDRYVEILNIFAGVAPGVPLMVQPNAGSPEREAGRIVYRQPPEEMAQGIEALVRAGARIVGGCCGTTPEHIRLFRREIDRINRG
ncbi:MAG: 5-methyltetrahydrofolate--homocysteine methyltransferase [Candidatus Sumerlaeota bacterium]|nr:5-methyltetrahydrofolate--homocysteine methyltransferase [Candidatus Sumerlaeota bacterium]